MPGRRHSEDSTPTRNAATPSQNRISPAPTFEHQQTRPRSTSSRARVRPPCVQTWLPPSAFAVSSRPVGAPRGGTAAARAAAADAAHLARWPWRWRRCRRASRSGSRPPSASSPSSVGRADAGQRLGVLLGDEVVDRLDVALGDRLGHHLRSPWPRLPPRARALRRRGRPPRLRPSASSTCACLRALGLRIADWRWPSASRISARLSRSAFICRPIDSTRSAGGLISLISTRVTLMPHGMRGFVDDAQQPLVDLDRGWTAARRGPSSP